MHSTIPFTPLTPVFVDHVIPLLDKDFDPFDSERSDIDASDDNYDDNYGDTQ